MSDAPTARSAAEDPTTILVIDDDEDLRTLLRRMIERAGFSAVTVQHGAEGRARFHAGVFDLVITDIVMPEMDGFEVIYTLRTE